MIQSPNGMRLPGVLMGMGTIPWQPRRNRAGGSPGPHLPGIAPGGRPPAAGSPDGDGAVARPAPPAPCQAGSGILNSGRKASWTGRPSVGRGAPVAGS